MAMVFALGHVSGCHINPAVSIAFRIIGRIDNKRLIAYVAAQLTGAVLAGLAIVAIIGQEGDAGASTPTVNGWDAAVASEVILTFFLALVVMAVATDHRAEGSFAAIAIGGYVAFAATAWGPVAGASMNPARSLGPALAANAWDFHWVYWLGPIAGAAIAVVVYELLREPHTPESVPKEGGSHGHGEEAARTTNSRGRSQARR
jgi:MIP family channel proteins